MSGAVGQPRGGKREKGRELEKLEGGVRLGREGPTLSELILCARHQAFSA